MKTLCNTFLLFLILLISNEAGAQNLITNGDFESGGAGTGFTTNYNLTGGPSSNQRDYAIVSNPNTINPLFSSTCVDHTTGSGKMMVVDGASSGAGGDKIWEQVPGGGISVVTGTTYIFSYWIQSISSTNAPGNLADIEVRFNGNIQSPSSGSTVCPAALCTWTKVTYTWVATSNYLQIWLYDKQTSGTGNDFALDDLSLTAVPPPLDIRYGVVPPSCPNSNDGFISVYGYGGVPPYSYSMNGSPYGSNNIFSGLGASTNNYLSVKDAATPSSAIVTTPATINVVAPTNPLTIRIDTTICSGSSVPLWASGGTGAYSWTAVPADPSIANPNSASTTASPTTTTTYTVNTTITNTRNLIYNGNFEAGDVGFYSDYLPKVTNPTGAQKTYGIVTNPNTFESGFSACVDHTTGFGKMMVVDGSLTVNDKVWGQNVPVTPGTNYTFSYWVQTLALPATNAKIEAQINGVPITGNATTSTLNAPNALCGWVQFTYTWNSGVATTAQIVLYDRVTAGSGNDFALDDISFTTTTICSLTKSVVVTVTTSGTPVTGFSYTSPVCANGTNPVPSPVAGFTTGGTYSSTAGLSINASTGVINLTASTPGTYTVSYTIAASGCSPGGSSTASITINPTTSPNTSFSYTTPVCANGTNPAPSTVAGFTTGGTYSSTAGLSINSSTGVINLAASTPGSYTVTYSLAASGCMLAGSNTASITINPTTNPTTGFSYTTPVCANAANPTPVTVAGFTTGGTYSSTAGLSINASTGVINLAASTPGSYTVTYTVAASGCMVAGSNTAGITINPTTNPVTGFSYTTPVCANGTNPAPSTVAGFTTGGTFSSTAGLSINSLTGAINLAASTPGSYTVTYSTAASGCMVAGSGTAGIVINPTTTPVTGVSYTTPVCANAANSSPSTVAGFTTGGTYSSTAGLSINASTGVISISSSTPGSYTVTYSVAASGCMVAGSGTASIVINPTTTPITGFSYTTPVCANGTNPSPATVAGFMTGGTYTSTAGLSINATTGVINLAASTPGSYTVTYTVAASACNSGGSSTTGIVINPITNPVTGFSYTTPVCANGTNPAPSTVAGFTTGGTFSSTAGLSINSTTGVINLAASTPGSYTVTYSVAASGCMVAGTNTAGITINPTTNPVTSFSYTSPVCANGTNPAPSPVAGFTTGGTYSSTAGLSINASTGVINLAASTPGSYIITYSVAASGCMVAGSNTTGITINPTTNPVTSFSYTSPVCANGTNPVPTPVGGFTTGGTYSSTAGLSINASTGVINLSASTPGSYTVNYSVSASGCMVAGSNTAGITINPIINPVTSFSYTSPVCANATNPAPSPIAGFTTGGTYSSTAGLSINASTGVINLAASTPGSYTVTYAVTASGCMVAGSNTAGIVINPTTNPVTSFSYTSPVCANATNPAPSPVAGFTTGGTYSSTAGLSINASTGVINLTASTPGSYTVTYAVTASGCMVAGSNTAGITINPIINPVTSFSYTSPVCANGTNPVPAPVAGFTTGGTYSSTAGLSINASTGIINLAASTPGSYNITYSVAASGCMIAGNNSANILINPVPVITGTSPSSICGSGTVNLGATGTGTVNWYSDAGLTNLVATGNSYSPSITGTTTYYVNASSNGCTGTSTSVTGTVKTVPGSPVVSPVTYCQGVQAIPLTATGTSLQWYTGPTGGLGSATPITPSTSSPGATDYYVTQTVNGCESPRINITVTVNPTPGVPGTSGAVTLCQNATPVSLSATGTNLLWYAAASGGPGSSTAPTPPTNTPGSNNYYVSQTINGCEGPRAAIPVTIIATPSAPSVSSPVTYCLNASATALSATGSNLLWYTGPSGGLGSNTAPTPSTATIGSNSYYVSQTVNGCESPRATITVITGNIPPAPLVNSPVSYCESANPVALTATGLNLLWYSSATGGPGSSTAPIPSTATAGSTDYYVSQTIGCESPRQLITVIVRPTPAAPVALTPVRYCQGTASLPLVAQGSGLLWYTTATGGTGQSANPVPSTSIAGTTSYYVSQSLAGCESQRTQVTVTINPNPVVDAGNPFVQIMEGESIILNGSVSGNNVSVLWTPNNNINDNTSISPRVSPASTTTYTLTGISTDGCIAADQVTVTVLKNLVIPNAFSPNADGINDKWVIKYIEQYPSATVEIFNRYGQFLYSSIGYSIPWDGTYKGSPVPVGTYYWIIKLPNAKSPLSGSVALIR